MARVCAVVLNSVSRDTRVLKEANTLAEAGHQVTIVGVADNNNREPETLLDNGVRIVRVTPPQVGQQAPLAGKILNFARTDLKRLGRLLVATFVLLVLALGWGRDWEDRSELLYLAGLAVVLAFVLRELSVTLSTKRAQSAIDRMVERLTIHLGRVAPSLFDLVHMRARARSVAMTDAVCETQPEVVHCHDVHTLPVGEMAKSRTGCRVVYDAHEIYEEVAQGSEATALRYRQLHRKHVRSVDRFITINESIAGWYREHYRKLPPATIVMNATVQAPVFDYDGRMHAAAELPAAAKILLYQGGYATKRGLDYLVQAAAYLPEDWTLVMMGWGRLEPHLRAIAEDVAKRADRAAPVRFIPPAPQADLAHWTAGATVGVIPYERIGLNHLYCTPNKLWEYPNAGVPVLVSPFPELRKPVEAYGCGWLLPDSQEPQELGRLVGSLTEVDIAKARKGCRAFIAADNWSRYAERLVGLYGELTGPAKAAIPARATDPGTQARAAAAG